MSQPARRLAITALALLIAAQLFRTQVSLALVGRGDDFLYRSQIDQAIRYYQRAVVVDPHSAVAADRLAFFSMHSNTKASSEDAVRISTRFLEQGDDTSIRADRGLAYLKLHRYNAATSDFEAVAFKTRDPRYFRFAASAAWRANRVSEARRLWNAARAAGYRPARGAPGSDR